MADINKTSHKGWGLETNMKIVLLVMAGSITLFIALLFVAWYFIDVPKIY